jgi:hypothetical protein
LLLPFPFLLYLNLKRISGSSTGVQVLALGAEGISITFDDVCFLPYLIFTFGSRAEIFLAELEEIVINFTLWKCGCITGGSPSLDHAQGALGAEGIEKCHQVIWLG